MSNQGNWMRDIADAADDLGYGIEGLTPAEIILSTDKVRVKVESPLLSGTLLRTILATPTPTEEVVPHG